jgi:hypothetical protein
VAFQEALLAWSERIADHTFREFDEIMVVKVGLAQAQILSNDFYVLCECGLVLC